MVIIRRAREEDAEEIRKLSISLTVPRTSKVKTGFIEYKTPSEKDFKTRIKESKLFYVAEDSNNIIGFLSAYTDIILRKLDLSEDKIIQHILKNRHRFVYYDQLAIEKVYQGKGIGKLLLKTHMNEVADNKYKVIYGGCFT